MRRAIGQSLRIDVAAHAVAVRRVGRWGGAAPTQLAAQAIAPSGEHPFDAIANALRAPLGELEVGGWPVSFTLADELTRLWRVTPPPGAARMADMEAAAGLRFQSLYGEPPSAWRISADWNATEPFFAAAVPNTLLAALQLVAQEFRLAIVGIAPRFVGAWNRNRRGIRQGAWFGVVHDNLLTLAAIDAEGKGVRAIRPLPIPHGADQYWLTQTLQREALLLDLAAPELLQVCGAAPADWTKPAGGAAYIPCAAIGGGAA
jgi:hypothetical protein